MLHSTAVSQLPLYESSIVIFIYRNFGIIEYFPTIFLIPFPIFICSVCFSRVPTVLCLVPWFELLDYILFCSCKATQPFPLTESKLLSGCGCLGCFLKPRKVWFGRKVKVKPVFKGLGSWFFFSLETDFPGVLNAFTPIGGIVMWFHQIALFFFFLKLLLWNNLLHWIWGLPRPLEGQWLDTTGNY